jgi:hypothetical protein
MQRKYAGRCEIINRGDVREFLSDRPSQSIDWPRRHLELLHYDVAADKKFDFSFVSLSDDAMRAFDERGRLVQDYEGGAVRIMNPAPPLLFHRYIFLNPYDSGFADEIRRRFTLLTPLNDANKRKLAEIRGSNSICMHVRRGDYKAHSGHRVCSPEYFATALRTVLRWTEWRRATVFVFSDDLPWCRKNIDFNVPGVDLAVDFVNVNGIDSPVFEMELMRNCEHFILSSGGFGEMAAFLKSGEKIVMRPNPYRKRDWRFDVLAMLPYRAGCAARWVIRSALSSVGLLSFARRVRDRVTGA